MTYLLFMQLLQLLSQVPQVLELRAVVVGDEVGGVVEALLLAGHIPRVIVQEHDPRRLCVLGEESAAVELAEVEVALGHEVHVGLVVQLRQAGEEETRVSLRELRLPERDLFSFTHRNNTASLLLSQYRRTYQISYYIS